MTVNYVVCDISLDKRNDKEIIELFEMVSSRARSSILCEGLEYTRKSETLTCHEVLNASNIVTQKEIIRIKINRQRYPELANLWEKTKVGSKSATFRLLLQKMYLNINESNLSASDLI